MENSKVRNLCQTCNLNIVQNAYKEVFILQANPSDDFLIKEIEWKLANAIRYSEWGFPFYNKEELEETKQFVKNLKNI